MRTSAAVAAIPASPFTLLNLSHTVCVSGGPNQLGVRPGLRRTF